MNKRTKIISTGAAALALAAGGAGVAIAGGSDQGEDAAEGPDVAISGDPLAKAEAAALDATGGGTVSGTEVGDEESLYEVEVTRDDGSQVDVQLDRGFDVVGSSADEEEAGDAD
ncbi:MAG: PepSY domain-containing protein [Solirubrobacterales bacterium]